MDLGQAYEQQGESDLAMSALRLSGLLTAGNVRVPWAHAQWLTGSD